MKNRILVVDDDALTLKLVRVRLEKMGYEIITAKNEREFWQHAFDPAITLIILDVCVKNRMGTDIHRSLLDFGMDKNIPVIFVTGLPKEELPSEWREEDKQPLYFQKPIDFDKLKQTIEHLQYLRELQDATGGPHAA
ncbi:MAG TPA: response regulator [Verrucomicrobiae bacterium]|jgi:DNA-binding NtrC family response regulator|nr:response regulator [Verrucomicrobiae bacterium]